MSTFQIAALAIIAFIPLAASYFSIQILRSDKGTAGARRYTALALIPLGAIAGLVVTAAPALLNADRLSAQAFAETSINVPASILVAAIATTLGFLLVTRAANQTQPVVAK